MNLDFANFVRILAGAAVGAMILWGVSFLIPAGSLGTYESILGLQNLGLAFGGLIGAAITIVSLVVRDSRHPETGSAANFSMINGIGSMLIGKSELRGDGSYLATEWFCFVWVPILPVCNYRVVRTAHQGVPFLVGSQQFQIREKHPVRLKDVLKGYAITAAAGCVIGLAALALSRWA